MGPRVEARDGPSSPSGPASLAPSSPPQSQHLFSLGQQRTLGKGRRPWKEGRAGQQLGGWLIDAAVGRGAPAVDVEIVSVLLVVRLVLEAQHHALITLTCLLVTLCCVERVCEERRAQALRPGVSATVPSTPVGSAQVSASEVFSQAQRLMVRNLTWVQTGWDRRTRKV